MSFITPHPPFHRCEKAVLLLHGFLATPHALSPLAARLTRSGYCTYCVDLGGLFGRFNARPIEEVAGTVAVRAERLLRDHRLPHLDMVGHSEGGLIGRYHVQKLSGASGAPPRHVGNSTSRHPLGVLWIRPAAHPAQPAAEAPQSRLLCELADETFPRAVRLTSIYSEGDTICPPASCRLDVSHGAHLKNVGVSHGGHLEFLFRKRFAAIVQDELGSDKEKARTMAAVSPPYLRASG